MTKENSLDVMEIYIHKINFDNPGGLWGYLSSSVVPENFEHNVGAYLQTVESILGEKLFLEMYIQKSTSDEEYLENLNDLNRIALLDDVHNARELLAEVRCLRTSSINLLDTLSIYTLEDEAQVAVDIANATLYNFERQPFIELREVARQKYRSIEKELSLANDDERKLELTTECFEWHNQLKDNELCLSDLQLNYFEKCCANLTAACDLMVEDQRRYGDDFDESIGSQRLDKKRKELYEQTIQLLLLKKKKLMLKRECIKEKVCQLSNNENFERELEALEKKFYQAQLAVFEIQFDIVLEEEKLHRLELKEYPSDEVENEDTNAVDAVDSDDNNEDIFHDCVQDEILLEKTRASKTNISVPILIPETSSIINEFVGTPNGSAEQDHGLFIRSNSLGHSPRRSLENKWAKRKVSVDQLRILSEPEVLQDDTCTSSSDNKWEITENKWLTSDSKCNISDNKWLGNENLLFKNTNFDIMSTSTGSTCSLTEENSLCRMNSNASIDSFCNGTNSSIRILRKNIPTVHNEEWYKRKKILQLLNRTCRKRAWLRNKKRKFLAEWKEKIDKKKQMENYYKEHHAIQLKREKQQEEMDQKKEMLEMERKKTLERLREHRKKYPDLVKRTPSRYNVPVRRTRNATNIVPFRPAGDPAVITPDSPTALRISSDIEKMRKTQDSKLTKKHASPTKLKRKNSKVKAPQIPLTENNDMNSAITSEQISIVAEEIEKTEPIVALQTAQVPPPQAQPLSAAPPPPPPPPPPPLPDLPPIPLPISHDIPKLRPERPKSFPIPPRLKSSPQPSPVERKGLDLSGIISARLRLKKTTTNSNDRKEDYALTDITASMLMNALNKMKKYTSDSTDEERDGDDLFD